MAWISTHAAHKLLLWPSGCARSERGKTSALPPPNGLASIALTSWWLNRCLATPKLVDEFAARLDPPLLRDLFKKMIDESRLAGELGVLLRVEDGIATELRHAREQFVKQRQTTGFLAGHGAHTQARCLGSLRHRR